MKNKIINFIKNHKFYFLLALIVLLLLFMSIISTFTTSTSSTIWDGSIANGFANGDGSIDNPYVISDGSELAFLFDSINGDNYLEYYNKSYIITNNINLNGYNFSFSKFDKTFSGTINGNGFTISNFVVDTYYKNDNTYNFNLFDSLDDSNIQYINFENFTFKVDGSKLNDDEETIDSNVIDDSNDSLNEETSNTNDETIDDTDKTDEVDTSDETSESSESSDADSIDDSANVEGTSSTTNPKALKLLSSDESSIDSSVSDSNTSNKEIINVSFFGNDVKNSSIANLSFNNVKFDIINVEDYIVNSSLLFINDLEGNAINNINLNFDSSLTDTTQVINNYVSSEIDTIIYTNNDLTLINNYEGDKSKFYHYELNNGANFDNKDLDEVLVEINVNSDLDWVFIDGFIRIESIVLNPEADVLFDTANVEADSGFTLTGQDSGVSGDTLYVNDLQSDYDYYKSLNYTYVNPDSRASLPGNESTGNYNDDYLVQVQIIYDGADINDSNLVGYVSPVSGEKQSKLIYYKYYPLARNSSGNLLTDGNGNHYISVELIDNPYSYRPYASNVHYGFNGWVCSQDSDSSSSVCNNSTLVYDDTYYVRYLNIPANGNTTIKVHLKASWVAANYMSGSYSSLSSLTDSNNGMVRLAHEAYETKNGYIYWNNTYTILPSSPTYTYSNRQTMTRGTYYRTSLSSNSFAYNSSNTRCPRSTTCYVYNASTVTTSTRYTSGSYIVLDSSLNGTTISGYNSTYMTFTENSSGPSVSISLGFVGDLSTGYNAIGYYYAVSSSGLTITNGLYYNEEGKNCNTGACSGDSIVYKLVQFKDSFSTVSGTSDANYYKYVTRDLNILEVTSSDSSDSFFGGSSGNTLSNYVSTYPFTLTTSAYGSTISTSIYFSSGGFGGSTFKPTSDMRIENATISGSNSILYANNYNLKVGRNVTKYSGGFGGSSYTFNGIVPTSGSSVNSHIYSRVIIESGTYNYATVYPNSSTYKSSYNMYFGSDYDRAKNDNSKLTFAYQVVGRKAGSVSNNDSSYKDGLPASSIVVKSGRYGTSITSSNYNNNSSYYTYGIYAGGISSGDSDQYFTLLVEGGDIFAINGGPLVNDNTYSIVTSTYIKGGTIVGVTGGAGVSSTYGARIISVSGGQVTNQINGGSNGSVSGGNNPGPLRGSTLVYVGGHAKVGIDSTDFTDSTDSSNWHRTTWFGVKKGTVYGSGLGMNGDSVSSSSGSTLDTHVIIDGGTIKGDVYGGGNYGEAGGGLYSGESTSSYTNARKTVIDIKGGSIAGNVYGGSNLAGFGYEATKSSSSITINVNMSSGSITGNVYGGSNGNGSSDRVVVYGTVKINVRKATINSVYGGGYGDKTDIAGNINILTSVSKNSDLNVNNIYGGSSLGNVNGTSTSTSYDTNINIVGGTIKNLYGGGEGSDSVTPITYGNTIVNISSGQFEYIYGGGNAGKVNKNASITMSDGKVTYDTYGGGNAAEVSGNASVTITGGDFGKNIYGGGNAGEVVGSTTVNVSNATIGDSVFGGGNAAKVNSATVTLKNDTITNNVFGGGNNGTVTTNVVTTIETSTIGKSVFGAGNGSGATVSGTSTLTFKGTKIGSDTCDDLTNCSIFGGGNAGAVTGSSTVNITGGSIVGSAFGAGNGSTATVGNGSTITIGAATIGTLDSLDGSVYGGGNAAAVTGNATVTLNGTTVKHNVVGGGNKGTISGKATSKITSSTIGDSVYGGGNEAAIGGNADLTITGSTVNKNVFGGGNAAKVIGSAITTISSSTIKESAFGGGKGGDATVQSSDITFNGNTIGVSTCTDLTKCSLYGGGNAGNVLSTATVKVTGGIIYGNIFGGGNEANVSTNVTLNIEGGTVEHNVYGGGNNGTTGGTVTTTISKAGTSDTIIKGSAFGGGNGETATVSGAVNISFSGSSIGSDSCTDVANCSIFGGGNAARVNNSTTVNVTGGTISGSAFGAGNGSTAVVTGNATIIVNDATIGTIDTIDGSVYGGGNASAVNGLTTLNMNGTTVKNNVFGGGNNGSVGSMASSTIVNCTIGESVFGGGKGSGAYVSGDAIIEIDGSTIGSESCTDLSKCSIFGGGNAGAVSGNTVIGIADTTIYGSAYGGGNAAGVGKDTSLLILSGDIKHNAFGGGNEGSTTASSTAHIMGGTIGENVFGGGNGSAAVVGKNSTLTISGGIISGNAYGGGNSAVVSVNSNVNVSDGEIKGILYGGGNAANVNGKSTLTITGGTFDSNVFGGGNEGIVKGAVTCNITDGNILGDFYGGGNAAEVSSGVTVTLTTTDIGGYTYAGGNNGAVVGSTKLTIDSCNLTKSIYGGGKGSTATVSVNAEVSINGTTSVGNSSCTDLNECSVFGGGNAGKVNGATDLIINNGTIYGNMYAGGNKAEIGRNAYLTINGGIVKNDAYGGGNEASIGGLTDVKITAGTINGNVFGGGNKGTVAGNASVSVSGGTIDKTVYGGGNAADVGGDTSLTITNGTFNYDVFGGGNAGKVLKSSYVSVIGGTFNENLYSGGNQASVEGNTTLVVTGGNIKKSVYGGGNKGVVNGTSNVTIKDTTILGSAYGGGNAASVYGYTTINISGTTQVGDESCTSLTKCSVYGSGNSASTGKMVGGTCSTNTALSTVNIAGGTIYGNVYGGANSSVVCGNANINIGADVELSTNIVKSPVKIYGTIFGGGESNASGSLVYTYDFYSVIKGISIDINGDDYDLSILGAIFGSGNASSSKGDSMITIKNYGTLSSPKKTLSIQRTKLLTLDNSSLNVIGETDSTNDYGTVKFSLSRIDEMDMINNSSLYLESGANLLQSVHSLASDGSKAKVTINRKTGDVDSSNTNANNRIYMYEGTGDGDNGEVLNISTIQGVTTSDSSGGEVYGMTFFGLYKYNANGTVNSGIYDDYENGATLNWGDVINKGSYVLGAHKQDHDITVDGFYTNYIQSNGTNKIDYIDPTSLSEHIYMWVIGETVVSYDIDLEASKYSTLGAAELPFIQSGTANTSFQIIGVDFSGLADGIKLVEKKNIPRIADTSEDADNVMNLMIEASNTGWLTSGSTTFLNEGDTNIIGTTKYVGENSDAIPSMLFYINHSKNISSTGDMGTVAISIMTITRIDDLTSETSRVIVNVNLSRVLRTDNYYEGSITEGRKYDLFATTTVNISKRSSLSAYFSLFSDSNIYKDGYHRALVSSYVLPLNTKLTLIDLSTNEYYYHVIDASDVSDAESQISSQGDVQYNLSMFEIMGAYDSSGSASLNYDDATKNAIYYDSGTNFSSEEFIVIIDYEDTTNAVSASDKNINLEMVMLNSVGGTIINILGAQHTTMSYSLYDVNSALIDIDGAISSHTLYSGQTAVIDLDTSYTRAVEGSITVSDTKYDDYKLGVELELLDKDGNIVTGTSLLGLYYEIDGVKYFPNIDGRTKIKIADKVGNVKTYINMATANTTIGTGDYTLRVYGFGSPDGLYYGLSANDYIDFNIKFINEVYGLDVETTYEEMVIDGTTGLNLNSSSILKYKIKYNSNLTEPSLRVKLYRRSYNEVYSNDYVLVNLQDYVSNTLRSSGTENEYIISSSLRETSSFSLSLKNDLQIGTYKVEFILYDTETAIGTVDKYIIIK